jgi:hypothetical protein
MSLAATFVVEHRENYTENGDVLKFLDKHCMFTFQLISDPLFLLFYVLSDRSVIIMTADTVSQQIDLSVGDDAMVCMSDKYKQLALSDMFGTVN